MNIDTDALALLDAHGFAKACYALGEEWREARTSYLRAQLDAMRAKGGLAAAIRLGDRLAR